MNDSLFCWQVAAGFNGIVKCVSDDDAQRQRWDRQNFRNRHIQFDFDVIDEAKADAYVYGYELLISSVVSILLVILIAAVCGDVRYALSFLIGFIPQRIYIGGYHATSHTRCYLAFTGLALICILLSNAIAANHLFRILTTAALLVISIFLSPIEAKNKSLGEKKKSSYKTIASILSSIDFLLAIFNVLPYTRHVVCYYLSKWVLIVFSTIPLVQQKFNANFCR